jgi:flagellar L-ring protein precursor FlgH
LKTSLLALIAFGTLLGKQHSSKGKDLSPIEEYIQAATGAATGTRGSIGSLYDTSGPFANNATDLRAAMVGDLVTVVVLDRASALSKGVVSSTRKSKAQYGISAAYGLTKSPLANLAGATGDRELQGQGETSRENALSTTLAARITHVLPNGNFVVEGSKSVTVNSESQIVRVRGIARRADITPANGVLSEKLSDLEIRIDGKGVVSDSVKRPFILYRILMGLLPF